MAKTGLIIEESGVTVVEIGIAGPAGADGAPGASASAGAVFATDVIPTGAGTVGNKTFVAGTIPTDIDILTADTDVDAVTILVAAEGGGPNEYTPSVTVDGLTVTNLVQDASDKRYYTGSKDITVSTTRAVPIASSNSGVDSVTITRLGPGPAITAFSFGALPGSQTEVKNGDLVPVTGTVENAATSINTLAFGAGQSGALSLGATDSGGVGFKTISGNVTIGAGSGALAARAQATNAFGTDGATFDTSNTVTLNQTFPTVNFNSIVYPATQNAVKDSETADVDVDATSFDTILYSSGNFSIPASTTYVQVKTITRTSGDYVNSGTNYSVAATKSSNDATTTVNVLVVIQHVAPEAAITIGGAPSRLRSSPAGQDYTITITADQSLQSAPTIVADSGTFQGSWAGGTVVWTRDLRIADTDAKGAQTFNTMVLPGLANRDGSTITGGSAYTTGGFTNRTITFAAFSQFEPIGTSVLDVTKTVASYTGASSLTRFADLLDHFQGFSISDNVPVYDATGDQFFLTDQAFTGANTSGTLQADIEETE